MIQDGHTCRWTVHTHTWESVCSGIASTSGPNFTAALATLNLILVSAKFQTITCSLINCVYLQLSKQCVHFCLPELLKSSGNSQKCGPILQSKICEWRPQVWITLTSYRKNGQLQQAYSKKSIHLTPQAGTQSLTNTQNTLAHDFTDYKKELT